MSFLNLFSKVIEAKLNMSDDIKKIHTPTPLNLTQDALVKMDGPDLALAQIDGSIMPNIPEELRVIAVGRQIRWGLSVYHSYLSDNKSFIRTITKDNELIDVMLFTLRDEIIPLTKEDWEFWLGRYQKDSAGEFVKDSSGKPIMAEYGLIGWPSFQIDGPPQILYNRSWLPSSQGIEPIQFIEEFYTGLYDGYLRIQHEAMEYERTPGENSTETLLVSTYQINDDASINIFIGIKLNASDIKVLTSTGV